MQVLRQQIAALEAESDEGTVTSYGRPLVLPTGTLVLSIAVRGCPAMNLTFGPHHWGWVT
jgi:hypothetical protein